MSWRCDQRYVSIRSWPGTVKQFDGSEPVFIEHGNLWTQSGKYGAHYGLADYFIQAIKLLERRVCPGETNSVRTEWAALHRARSTPVNSQIETRFPNF